MQMTWLVAVCVIYLPLRNKPTQPRGLRAALCSYFLWFRGWAGCS